MIVRGFQQRRNAFVMLFDRSVDCPSFEVDLQLLDWSPLSEIMMGMRPWSSSITDTFKPSLHRMYNHTSGVILPFYSNGWVPYDIQTSRPSALCTWFTVNSTTAVWDFRVPKYRNSTLHYFNVFNCFLRVVRKRGWRDRFFGGEPSRKTSYAQ